MIRVAVEPGSEVDLVRWAREHAAGERAEATPYGLAGLPGAEVLGALPPRRRRLAHVVLARARVDPATALRRLSADVVLAQHEKIGVPAVLSSALPGRPPVVTGVIWLTDDSADLPQALQRLLRRALRRAAAVFVLSDAQVPVLLSWGLPRERVHVVPFGVEADFWCPEGEPEPGLVVTAGSDRDRDQATLVQAVGRVRGELDARLEVAGAQAVPPAPGVRALGSLTHAGLRAAYRRASVVAVATRPNLHVSGVTVALEAMACAVPVVVSATPGMEAYVRHGETGLLVPPGDAVAMADAIASLLRDPRRARALGEAARGAVQAAFTSRHYAHHLGEVCRSSVARRRPPAA